MAAHHVDHPQYPLQQPHFNAPHQQQPHPQPTPVSPQPQYYHASQDHSNGYTNAQPYVEAQQPAYAVAPANIQQAVPARTSIVPAQSITQETYQSPVIAQPGSDWAKDLIRQARSSELKKHSLTLQLHTAQILSATASLEQRNKKLEGVRAEKNWLESERARLLECLRELNEEREKVDLTESSLLKEINEFKTKIQAITEGEYKAAKKEVDLIRKDLGMPPLPSLQATLEKSTRGFVSYTSVFGMTDSGSSHNGSSHTKRRLNETNEEPGTNAEGVPATVNSSVEPTLQSEAHTMSGTAPIKRGPGRPRKVPLDNNGVSPAVPGSGVPREGEPPAKRPRGRPKGSRNKPKHPAQESAPAST